MTRFIDFLKVQFYKRFLLLNEDIEILKIGNSLVKYVKNNQIKNIIFVDKSARPSYLVFRYSWHQLFDDTSTPNIYFTNPNGYNFKKRKIEKIAQEFDLTYPRLAKDKNSKLLLFDTCMHTGKTLESILSVLQYSGYGNVLVGLCQPPRYENSPPNVSIDFQALNKKAENCCYPFGRDLIIDRDSDEILSQKDSRKDYRFFGIKLRKDLIRLCQHKLKV